MGIDGCSFFHSRTWSCQAAASLCSRETRTSVICRTHICSTDSDDIHIIITVM